jgi:hypothetical protein
MRRERLGWLTPTSGAVLESREWRRRERVGIRRPRTPVVEILESRRVLSVNIATFPLRGEGTYPEGIATGAGADQNIWFTLVDSGGNIGMINPLNPGAGVTQYPIPTSGPPPGIRSARSIRLRRRRRRTSTASRRRRWNRQSIPIRQPSA